MAIDKDAIREHVRGILAALGDDPDREGLKETPDRVARMYEEVFEGMNYTCLLYTSPYTYGILFLHI